jgi:hypothetical protein
MNHVFVSSMIKVFKYKGNMKHNNPIRTTNVFVCFDVAALTGSCLTDNATHFVCVDIICSIHFNILK